MFVGVNLTFFPQHFLGLGGMPRRYSDYPDVYTFWNLVSSVGSIISVVSVLIFFVALWEAFRAQRPVLFPSRFSSSIEWLHNIPPADHSYDEVPLVSYS